MRHQKTAGILVITLFVIGPALSAGEPTVKLRGYIAAKSDDGNLRILQDAVQLSPGTKFVLEDAPQGEQFGLQDLTPGMLIEAQGTWLGKHQFAAQKVTCDWDQFDKEIKESAFLDYEPEQPEKISSPVPAQLKVDGEVLTMNEKTKRAVQPLTSPGTGGANPPGTKLMWRRVRYRGVRGSDGKVNAEEVEIGSPPPLDAFKIGDDVKVVRGRDPQTGIEVLEFRNKKEVLARMKLFPVQQVQDYVSSLGTKLLPASIEKLPSANTPEFRFYVIESADLNAAALPDGTVLVNTGLLAALENEAQLAFVLGHEIAHVTQAHSWRQVHETRNKRIGLAIAGIAAAIAVGVMESNAGYYGPGPLSNLVDSLVTVGMAAIWNGYERKLENQAARLGLQALIDRGSRKSSSSGMGTARASPSGPTTSRASSAGAS